MKSRDIEAEMLELIERFIGHSRAWTADAEEGEAELWEDALRFLERYGPASVQTSSAAS